MFCPQKSYYRKKISVVPLTNLFISKMRKFRLRTLTGWLKTETITQTLRFIYSHHYHFTLIYVFYLRIRQSSQYFLFFSLIVLYTGLLFYGSLFTFSFDKLIFFLT